ncbi:hypothetical protein JHD49_08125 [Sulfurimonas sp. SAG-AH-194-C21]|nr:porin [Sulfurimonas sp. SAG-AH-194-C21]MDF1883900.1 hypothetical protein [Sulfurimonas sp. SAG-AH-194-C21]
MKIVILFFLLVTFLFGAEESCYSVQLTSAFKTQQSSDELRLNEYDTSCKVMEIGSNILVRCGCFTRFKEASKHLKQYENRYKDAYILSTYRSRFTTISELPLPLLETPIVVHKTEILEDVIPVAVFDVSNMKEEKPVDVKKEQAKDKKAKKKAKKRAKKKEKKAKKKAKKKKEKKAKKRAKKKKEKKAKKRAKKKKEKRAKKRVKSQKKKNKTSKAQQYGYNRYFKKIRSSRASGKYKYEYKFGAQISYDIAYINESDQSYLDSDFRRIRIYHKGSFLNKKLFYELEYSFTGSSQFKDNYIGYKNYNKMLGTDYRVQVGNIKIPFSLERYTSSKYNMFMERALTDAYGESRQLGAEILLHKKFTKSDSGNLFLSLFTSSIDERLDEKIIKQGFSIRTTYAHKWRKNHLLSIGGAYFAQDVNNDSVKFNETAESYLMQDKYISASIKAVKRLTKANIELLYINDKYSLQGEYTQVGVDAINKSTTGQLTSYAFNGYYMEGSYFLIGKGRKYRTSTASLKKTRLNKDGAVELAMRYSYINLNDKDENNNGQQVDYTLGANWYINDEIKLMLNYIVAEPSGTKLYTGRLHILQTRMLFAF